MDYNLVRLSEKLKSLGYNDSSKNIISIIAKSNKIAEWQEVVDEVKKPIPKQIFGRSIKYVIDGIIDLTKASQQLNNVSHEDISMAIQIGTKIPGAIKGSSINIEVIKKFSKQFDTLDKTAQMSLLKSLKGLGAGALKVIPIIGVVFSAALAIKNLIYGFMEFKSLMGLSEQINMPWYDTLFASKIESKISEFEGIPSKLVITTQVCKVAKVFIDEAISFAANFIDFVKDLIFLIIEAVVAAGSTIIPPGWAATLGIGSLDVTISIIIMIIEYYTEGAAKEKYNIAIARIGDIAEQEIKSLSQTDYNEWDDDKLFNYFSK